MSFGALRGTVEGAPFSVPIGATGGCVLGWDTLGCDADSGLSEVHLAVRVDQDRVSIRDLNSTGGTELERDGAYTAIAQAGPLALPVRLRLGGLRVDLDHLDLTTMVRAARSTRHVRPVGPVSLVCFTDSRGHATKLEASGNLDTASFSVNLAVDGAVLAALLRAHAGSGFGEADLAETIRWAPLVEKDGSPLARGAAQTWWGLPAHVPFPLVPPHPHEVLQVEVLWRRLKVSTKARIDALRASLECTLSTAARSAVAVEIRSGTGHHRYRLTTSVRVASVSIISTGGGASR